MTKCMPMTMSVNLLGFRLWTAPFLRLFLFNYKFCQDIIRNPMLASNSHPRCRDFSTDTTSAICS